MASSITNDVRLDSPDDWDEWETALLNQAETYHILLVLQGIEDPISKPEVRRIKDFMLKDIPLPSQPPVAPPTGPTPSASTARIGAAAGTRGHTASQPSQDSETVQSTESQEDVPSTMDTMDKERRKQIEKDALYAFSVHNNEYRVLYQLWETQCRDVNKIFNWMKKTISSDYAAVFILLKQARTTKDLEAWIVNGMTFLLVQNAYSTTTYTLRGRPSRGSFATQAGGNDNRSDHEAPHSTT
uniref:Chaperone protein ClpB n=1 Tax=Talaromyces marneffei PM1 TaxID=1077442 RepID=A0A093X7E4_TALMA